jgi:hypothetical protein
MELLWFFGFITGLVLLALLAAGVAWWSRLYQMKFEARLKQDMLARGLSVEDIERLLNISSGPGPGHASSQPVAKEPFSLTAYRLAGAIENMVENGKETGEVAALLEIFLTQSGKQTEVDRELAAARRADAQRLSSGLAPALESMVQAGRTKEEIAAFLDTFLPRGGEPPGMDRALDQPFPPIEAAVRSSDIQRLGSGRDG